MKFTLFTAFVFSVWMNAADGDDRPLLCCLTVTNTRIPVQNIVKYDVQRPPICPINAVRFLTKKGKYICSDPNNCWAIRAIKGVSCRKNKEPYKETMCFTSTTKCGTGGPAALLTETPGQDTDQTTSSSTTNRETTSTETTTATPTTVTTITTTQTETETSTRETKSISATANKASSDVDGKSSFTITVQTTTDPENSRTISEVDMGITTPPQTTFKETELEVAASAEDCCLTVTENRAAIHETEETPAEDWDYIQNLNRRTPEQTDKREFIRKTKALEQNRVRSAETTDTLQLDGLSEESSSSQINHPYTNNNEYFCLKKEPVQYFCIKQP